jgi:hypothetical protein
MFGLLLAAALACGQKLELGARVGAGGFAAEDLEVRMYANAGVEACGWCSRGFALFGEYSHWEETSAKFPTRNVYTGGNGAHSLGGIVLGGGAAVSIRERWYIRPQVRVYALSGYHVATSLSVGIGYRF